MSSNDGVILKIDVLSATRALQHLASLVKMAALDQAVGGLRKEKTACKSTFAFVFTLCLPGICSRCLYMT